MPFYTYSKDERGCITLDLRGTPQAVIATLRRLMSNGYHYTITNDHTDHSCGRPERSCVVTITN